MKTLIASDLTNPALDAMAAAPGGAGVMLLAALGAAIFATVFRF